MIQVETYVQSIIHRVISSMRIDHTRTHQLPDTTDDEIPTNTEESEPEDDEHPAMIDANKPQHLTNCKVSQNSTPNERNPSLESPQIKKI